jgi:hypothetical protein
MGPALCCLQQFFHQCSLLALKPAYLIRDAEGLDDASNLAGGFEKPLESGTMWEPQMAFVVDDADCLMRR